MYKYFIFFSTIILYSCNIINKNEPKFGIIKINGFKVEANGNDYGSLDSKINSVWVSYNGVSQGVYELPAEIPLLEGENKNLILSAGVKKNGISESIIDYPFYDALFDTISVNENFYKDYDTISIKYLQAASLKFNENFELGNNFFEDLDGNTETNVLPIINQNVYEGNKSGYIQLNSQTNAKIEVAGTAFNLTKGKKHFLELNYKCNIPFKIGLVGSNEFNQVIKTPILIINKKTAYNKIYIQLNSISDNLISNYYKIFILAEKPSDVQIGEIFLDNVKVLEM